MEEYQQMATQNPTTSQPQWPYHQMHPGHPQMQQYQHIPPQYPRSPSRAPPNQHTAQWMNQQYVQNWQQPYASSPVPSVTPSLMSHGAYQDDRMSVLSVNTTLTAVPPDMDPQRCFSSNGSTCENINPDMALAQLSREAEIILHNWFAIGDPVKRSELSTKLLLWIKSGGMESLNETQFQRSLHQVIMVMINGMAGAHNPAVAHKELADVAYKMFEILHRLFAREGNLAMLTQAFCIPSPEKQLSLRDAICPFIDRIRDQRSDRMSHIAVESIHLLISQKDAAARTQCLKALKVVWMVHALIKNLAEIPQTNWRVIYIIGMLIRRDNKMKDYMLHLGGEKQANATLVQILLDNVLPKVATVEKFKASKIVRHTCWVLYNLLYEENSIDYFITNMNGITKVCHALRTADQSSPPLDVIWEAFKLFEHVSDRPKFNDVDIPLAFIIHLMATNEDWDIYKLGTGFLSNVVANKPKYKRAVIQCNCFQLLRHVITKFPAVGQVPDGKRRLVRLVMANCMRTLINILPFWLNDANRAAFSGMPPEQQQQIMAAVHSFLSQDMVKLLMNMLVWEELDSNNDDYLSIIELRNLLLRILLILLRVPFINKAGIFDVFDDLRKENLVGNALYTFYAASQMCQRPNTKPGEKEEKDRQLERSVMLIRSLADFSQQNPEIRKTIANYFRHKMGCPLELLTEKTPEALTRVLLELCVLVVEASGEIPTSWNLDRAMIEAMANNRNAEIANAAQNLLGKMPVSSFDPLADVFANSEYQFY